MKAMIRRTIKVIKNLRKFKIKFDHQNQTYLISVLAEEKKVYAIANTHVSNDTDLYKEFFQKLDLRYIGTNDSTLISQLKIGAEYFGEINDNKFTSIAFFSPNQNKPFIKHYSSKLIAASIFNSFKDVTNFVKGKYKSNPNSNFEHYDEKTNAYTF